MGTLEVVVARFTSLLGASVLALANGCAHAPGVASDPVAIHESAAAARCMGLDEVARRSGPFTNDVEIADVGPLRVRLPGDKLVRYESRGAMIVIQARPGVTPEWLERLSLCHMAFATRTGSADASLAWSPLAVEDVRVAVVPAAASFVLEIEAPSTESARIVLERALSLPGWIRERGRDRVADSQS
jgi:hypothetical protein